MKGNVILCLIAAFAWSSQATNAQPVYFADGQHGGVYGHYPLHVTQFLVDQLREHPDWRINLEIEPPTWDVVQSNTPAAYAAFRRLAADQSASGRIEFVNPQYAQSYLWNITGESMIRQFEYGMAKIRQHFPNAVFTTYSSEEPMFTSALPGILKSFGFKYAVLKNPDTCWGGYTRAFGGELVNWIGPDGTQIPTVPRYAIEALKPGSTWQTIAWNDSADYINAALKAGVKHPIGMCYQDAGWRNGPWVGEGARGTHPIKYETWRNYFENVAIKKPTQAWRFSQEDVLVSLVWGAQVLQHIAQEVRGAENKILMAEKLSTLGRIYASSPWPGRRLDEAWRTLMLAEHHDCWIVPYNRKNGSTWAEHVARWTRATSRTSDKLMREAMGDLSPTNETPPIGVRVFNTLGVPRTALASVVLPENWRDTGATVLDFRNRAVPCQLLTNSDSHACEVLFLANVPSMGFNTYHLRPGRPPAVAGAGVAVQTNGTVRIDTDLYRIVVDPARGGIITSLIARKVGGKDFVDVANARGFNEIRGYFYRDGGFHSSADHPAQVSVLERGPVRVRLRIKGTVDTQPFTEILSVAQGRRAIDFDLTLGWRGNPGIGSAYGQDRPWRATEDRKAFYDDRYKLLVLFPLNLRGQRIFKNAPFDALESHLSNTFFDRWSGIKNNIILNWVDVTDASNRYGLALLTDHTTSYEHGRDFPLGLTLQYDGKGLWGKNYRVVGPSEIHFALVPHGGTWRQAGVWTQSDEWNQPLTAMLMNGHISGESQRSLVDVADTGLVVSAMKFHGRDLLVRVFNAEGAAGAKQINYDGGADDVELVELDGTVIKDLPSQKRGSGASVVTVDMPRFAIRTIRFCDARE